MLSYLYVILPQGELEGSKLYQELETGAKQYFVTNVLPGTKRKRSKDQDNVDNFLPMGAMVVKLLSKVSIDHEFYKERATRLVPADGKALLLGIIQIISCLFNDKPK